MSALKTITRNDLVRGLICRLGALYIRFVHASGRWQVLRGDIPEKLCDEGRPFIACFWHGRLLMMGYAWQRSLPFHMLVSAHPDGQLIAKTIALFGFGSIAGSTRRGGSTALRVILKTLEAGEIVGVTPDGPRGPRMRASNGIINIARLAGVPILPLSYGVSRRRVLNTWDRFILPLPFARGAIAWGEPVFVARDADEAAQERARRAVEDGLNAVTAEVDARYGFTPIEPAPAPEPAAP